VPLLGLMRKGASDAMLSAVMHRNVAAKQSHHPSLAVPRGQFSMADLGG
jgi:hypothetical protein